MLHPQDRVLSTLNSAGGKKFRGAPRPLLPPAADNVSRLRAAGVNGPRGSTERAGAKPAFRRGALASSVESSSSGLRLGFIDAAAGAQVWMSLRAGPRAATRKLWAGAAARE